MNKIKRSKLYVGLVVVAMVVPFVAFQNLSTTSTVDVNTIQYQLELKGIKLSGAPASIDSQISYYKLYGPLKKPAPVPVPVPKPAPAPAPVPKPAPVPVPVPKPAPVPVPVPKPAPAPVPVPKPAPAPVPTQVPPAKAYDRLKLQLEN